MTYPYGYSAPPKQLTLAEMELRSDWYKVHPELRRRLVALMDACPHDLGVGGGWRSAALQEQTFRSRYIAHPTSPGIAWLGLYWRKKPGVAPSAPPGLSFHESSTPDGFALAVDMLNVRPAIDWAGAHAAEFGVRDFSDVNSEPWHFQPVEIPNARRNYNPNVHVLGKFPLSGGAAIPPPHSGLIDAAPPAVLSKGVVDLHRVRWLQQILNERFGAALVVDGGFGDKTHNAVIVMQQILGVGQDGVYGQQTAEALAAWLAKH